MYIFPLFAIMGKRPHRYNHILPLLVSIRSTLTQNTRLFFLLLLGSVYGALFLVYFAPCIFMWRCTIVVLVDLSIWFLVILSYSPDRDFKNIF